VWLLSVWNSFCRVCALLHLLGHAAAWPVVVPPAETRHIGGCSQGEGHSIGCSEVVCGILPLWGGRGVGRLTCVAMNTAQHVASHAGSIMLVCTCNPRRRRAKQIREQIVGDWLPTPAHSQRSTWSWGCHSHNRTLPFSIDGAIAYDQHWSCGRVVPSLQIM
jgi:hypothetical protein